MTPVAAFSDVREQLEALQSEAPPHLSDFAAGGDSRDLTLWRASQRGALMQQSGEALARRHNQLLARCEEQAAALLDAVLTEALYKLSMVHDLGAGRLHVGRAILRAGLVVKRFYQHTGGCWDFGLEVSPPQAPELVATLYFVYHEGVWHMAEFYVFGVGHFDRGGAFRWNTLDDPADDGAVQLIRRLLLCLTELEHAGTVAGVPASHAV